MPTRYRGSAREVRALNTLIKLMRATETLGARLGQGLATEGVTPAQLSVLEALHHLGSMHQRELGRKLLRSDANMTTVLDNLEQAGLIGRERSAVDRRLVEVTLSVKGKRCIEQTFPPHAARLADFLGVLTSAEQDELGRLCKKLGLGLSR